MKTKLFEIDGLPNFLRYEAPLQNFYKRHAMHAEAMTISYVEVLGLLVPDFSIFFLAFFSFPTDQPQIKKCIR